MRYVLYNPLSTHCLPLSDLAKELRNVSPEEDMQFVDATKIEDYEQFMKGLKKDDDLVISGGDGTLNKSINFVDFSKYPNKIYLHKAGNGNDFLRDINELKEDFIEITEYVKNLPTVKIGEYTSKFINGVGLGVDGMVCVESDKMKAKGKKNINYTSLSIRLLLTKFKRFNADVVVDGKEYKFKHCFIASAMLGKYYGGGMKEAPDQDRRNDVVSVVIWHNLWSLTALMNFPKIFTGEHVLKTKKITVLTGKNIELKCSRPTDVQIDGESIHGILGYSVKR
ncbi:MAG: diacylglycerol kinase family protein [Bacilli bacterium]|nr:diacylglycerol kinase family protein [Bacilli bacterium]